MSINSHPSKDSRLSARKYFHLEEYCHQYSPPNPSRQLFALHRIVQHLPHISTPLLQLGALNLQRVAQYASLPLPHTKSPRPPPVLPLSTYQSYQKRQSLSDALIPELAYL